MDFHLRFTLAIDNDLHMIVAIESISLLRVVTPNSSSTTNLDDKMQLEYVLTSCNMYVSFVYCYCGLMIICVRLSVQTFFVKLLLLFDGFHLTRLSFLVSQ